MFRQEEALALEFLNTVQILCRAVSCGLLLKKKKFGEGVYKIYTTNFSNIKYRKLFTSKTD
jgi:hypothetical protein